MTAHIDPAHAADGRPDARTIAADAPETTIVATILAVSLGHFLNDLMQSLIPAAYPLLKENLSLSFTQIGAITFVFQGTASILQPLVGLYTDRRPMPFALSAGMASTGAGLLLLARATDFLHVLIAVALIGLGSSIFHPEASRIARIAAGMRPGFAQAVFQVGGNTGTAIGPLAAAFIVLERGQHSIGWFAAVALIGMILLFTVGRWYVTVGAERARIHKARVRATVPLPRAQVRLGMIVLIVLMVSKFLYSVSFSSYYTFFLIERFGLSKSEANVFLFVFLAAVAAGTVIGGPIGDRIGLRRVIQWSIVGTLPLTLVIPWLPLIPNLIFAGLAGMILASAFPAMVVYAQDLMPQKTGTVAGLLYGLAFGIAAFGAAVLGMLADRIGIVAVYQICAFLPVLGIAAFLLPDPRRRRVA